MVFSHRLPARAIPLTLVPLLMLALAFPGCGGPGAPSAAASAQERSRRAGRGAGGGEALTVRRGPFEETFLLTGELEAAQAIHLTVPQTPSWRVDIRWLAEDGTAVEEGDRVIELDNSEFVTDLEDKERSLQEKVSELERREAETLDQIGQKEFAVTRAEAELKKARIQAELPEGIVPRQELADRRLELEKAESELEKARAELRSERASSAADLEIQRIEIEKARREIEVARASIEELTLEAPADGLFLVETLRREDRKIQVGDTVWAGLTVGTIPDLSSLRVRARLPDVDDGRVRPGMAARVVLDAYPEEVLSAEVTKVTPIAREKGSDSLRRFFDVEVALDESDPARLIPGMSARVEVVQATREDALLAPRAALVRDGDDATDDRSDRGARAVRSDGELVRVRLGPCDPLECVVEAGLEAGAELARAGSQGRIGGVGPREPEAAEDGE